MPLALNLEFESGISDTKKDRMLTMLANKHQTYGTKNAKWVVMEAYKSEENQIYFQTNKSGNKDFVDDMTTLFSEVTEDNNKRLIGKLHYNLVAIIKFQMLSVVVLLRRI
mmetsp:Transcript_19993/g.22136  ORF Transcript_19993/g.22136 Transcript_19993/m.22136 type:complete len:110 (-) Transcript_19993:502-831(-)